MSIKNILVAVIVYLAATSVSYGAFHYLMPSEGPLNSPLTDQQDQEDSNIIVKLDPSVPKTEVCPLNGLKYTKAEKDIWTTRRPLLVMVENHLEARPQASLQNADVVYEAVAEGGITRFMGVFYCDAVHKDLTIGPVRSARTYFLDWASEYSDHPLYAHVGGGNVPGPADALGQIIKYGWGGENDLNQFGLSVKECQRDDTWLKKANGVDHVATEHTMYCSSEALWKVGANRGWAAKDQDGNLWTDTFTPWKFTEAKASDNPTVKKISFDFWKDFYQYAVQWEYDSTTNLYTRSTGGKVHTDVTSNEPLKFSVIITQFVTEKGPIDDHKHMLYGTTGSGKAKVYQNGTVTDALWTKKTRTSRTVFTDIKGKEIQFSAGKIWIEELPTTSVVKAE